MFLSNSCSYVYDYSWQCFWVGGILVVLVGHLVMPQSARDMLPGYGAQIALLIGGCLYMLFRVAGSCYGWW